MSERSARPRAPWVGPPSLWASFCGTLIAMVGVGASVTHGLLAPAALLLTLGPAVVGLLLLLSRSMRRVGVGLVASLLVPVLTAVALWAGFGLAGSWL